MEIKKIKPKIRYLAEMKEVLFDQEWAKTAPNLKLYYMYRDLAENDKDKQVIIEQGFRYDITVLPFVMLGKEFNKTAGHDHPVVPQAEMTYPEIYEVLEGEAIFLFQDSQGDKINDVYIVKARERDKVIIPPNYEHLMINASGKEFKTANWICRDFPSNIYKPFRSKHGFCYYALIEDSEKIKAVPSEGKSYGVNWLRNKNYTAIPPLKSLAANLWLEKFGIAQEEEMYHLVKDLSKLDFLKRPEKYSWS